jgi:glutathione peroxidase
MLIADIQIERIKSLLSRSGRRFEPWGKLELHVPLPANIPLKTIDGEPCTLGDFAGQALLIVNVASQCGFTPQYTGLEALHRRFRERGFAVLGFPCDQFGHQEPGDEAAIRKFCTDKYDVTFPMFAKIEVNGANVHPLFQTLKHEAPGLLGTQAIKWNFTKFLIDRQLRVVRRYAPSEKPEKLSGDIEAILG